MITVFQALSSGDINVVLRNMKYMSRYGFGTSLHEACTYGHLDVVRLLIRGGAPLNSLDEDGMTPLERAYENGSRVLIEIVLEAKRKKDL